MIGPPATEPCNHRVRAGTNINFASCDPPTSPANSEEGRIQPAYCAASIWDTFTMASQGSATKIEVSKAEVVNRFEPNICPSLIDVAATLPATLSGMRTATS